MRRGLRSARNASLTCVCLLGLAVAPAFAGLQTYSGTLASCSGGGFDVDLVATGKVEDVAPSRTEVMVERVVLGDRSYAGKELIIQMDSDIPGDVGFQEGASYELYLQDEGDHWKTNVCLGTRESVETPRTGAGVLGPDASTALPTIPETGGPGLPVFVVLGGFVFVGNVVTLRLRTQRRE